MKMDKNGLNKVSVIVPVYNTSKYLTQCLDSLINQTLRDIEIVCLNDGSTDKSLDILNEYAQDDDRIKVYSQPNAGLSATRNNALNYVTGDYLMYLDSDDWLDLEACATLHKIIIRYNADVVMFPYIREYGNVSLRKHIFDEEIIIYNEKECHDLHRRHSGLIDHELSRPQNSDALCSTSTKLYKTRILTENNLGFVDTRIVGSYEDGLFNLHYFGYIKKAVYINRYFLHYRKNNMDSLTTVYNPNRIVEWDNLYDRIREYIVRNRLGEDYSIGLQNRIALGIITLGINIASSNLSFSEKIKSIQTIINKPNYQSAFKQLKLGNFPVHWYIFFWLCKNNMNRGVLLMSFLINRLRRTI